MLFCSFENDIFEKKSLKESLVDLSKGNHSVSSMYCLFDKKGAVPTIFIRSGESQK